MMDIGREIMKKLVKGFLGTLMVFTAIGAVMASIAVFGALTGFLISTLPGVDVSQSKGWHVPVMMVMGIAVTAGVANALGGKMLSFFESILDRF